VIGNLCAFYLGYALRRMTHPEFKDKDYFITNYTDL